MINVFGRKQSNQAGLRTLRAATGQNGRAMVTETACNDGEMAEASFVAAGGTRGRKVAKIFCRNQAHLCLKWTRQQSDVCRYFQPAHKFARVTCEQTFFGGS